MPRTSTSTAAAKAPVRARKTASKSSVPSVFDLLKEDHSKVKKMFKQFEKMKKDKKADESAKQMLVQAACKELMAHAQLEEELFYPALRNTLSEMHLVNEAAVEHASAKMLIKELQSMNPSDELFEAKFTVLSEYVQHHIEEEEKEIFPKAKKAKVNAGGLAEEMAQRREALRAELGITSDIELPKPGRKTAATKRKTIH